MGQRIELPGGMSAQLPDENTELLRAIANNTMIIAGILETTLRMQSGQVPKSKIKGRYDAFDAEQQKKSVTDAMAEEMQKRNEENDPATD